ncbi:deoxyribose-phosphate aldolase [Candidatus Bathyarchaeota archaeon]|nr:MAG: deoxyribose-phosphate aldolase [Candidatus Bathyarchaeota archaeon]
MKISRAELAKMIDSTNIKPDATREQIVKLCQDAIKHGFCCVAVNPTYVPLAVNLLKGSQVKVCATVGFPYGATLPEVKAYEAKRVVELGAEEIDMVMNISAFKSGDYELVKRDIEAVTTIKKQNPNVIVKVIIETGLLKTQEEKVKACRLVKEAGADFVKTSVGTFGKATVEDVRLMRRVVGEDFGVKAAGGIRTYQDAIRMIKVGANRIGTSTAVAIVEGAPS